MQRAIKIFTLARIPVYVHWSFSLLIFFLMYYRWYTQMDSTSFVIFLFLFFSLFVSVIFHEYGHALSAKYFGVKTKDIILLPIGGLARVENLPEKPLQEFVIAAAGPAINLIIALILGIVLWLEYNGEIGRIFSTRGTLILRWHRVIPMLFVLNLALAIMNLIPAFPLDGGRMLRAVLAIKLGRIKATKIASYLGQALSVLLIGYGIFHHDLMSILLGFFLFFTARKENRILKTEHILSQHLIEKAMKKTYPVLYATDSLSVFLSTLPIKEQKDFLVLNLTDQSFSGILTVEKIKNLRTKMIKDSLIGSVVENDIPTLNPKQTVAEGLSILRSVEVNFLPVLIDQKFVGILDYDSINQLLKIKSH